MKLASFLAAALLLSPLHAADPAPAKPNLIEAMRDKAKVTKCQNNARQLSIALMAWQLDHDDLYPATLDALKGDFLKELDKVTTCPFDPEGKPGGYELLLAGKSASAITQPAKTPLLQAKFTDSAGLRTVVFVDGHVERVKDQPAK